MKAMYFVDGTNVLSQIANKARRDFELPRVPFQAVQATPDFAFRLANQLISESFTIGAGIIRRYWFGSYQGDDERGFYLKKLIRSMDFEPVLFKLPAGSKQEKGVDIELTKEMLVNAFNQNMDLAVLVAGDRDYCGLVQEVKRYGPRVYGTFFGEDDGLSSELALSFDSFHNWSKKNTDAHRKLSDAKQEFVNMCRT